MEIVKYKKINRIQDDVVNIEKIDENYLAEMANLKKDETGLPYDIWLDTAGYSRTNRHYSPRIKVLLKDNNLIPFLIDKYNPDIPSSVKKEAGINYFRGFRYIKEYIKEYYDILLDHYYMKISDKEALSRLGKLGERGG